MKQLYDLVALIILFCFLSPVVHAEGAAISSTTLPSPLGAPHVCGIHWYPEEALRAGIEGRTVVRFVISTDGTVKSPEIASSSGNTEIDTASLNCVSKILYKPATKDGQPVEIVWAAAAT